MLIQKKATTKLYFLIIVFSIFILLIGQLSISSLHWMNKNTITTYEDRMLPLQQLTQMRYAYATGILVTSEELENNLIEKDKAIQQIESAEINISNNWSKYTQTVLTKDERKLVNEAIVLKKAADKIAQELKVVIITKKGLMKNGAMGKQLYSKINPLVNKLNELAQLQVKIASDLKVENKQVYKHTIIEIYVLIGLILLIGGIVGHLIVRDNKYLIRNLILSYKKLKQVEEKCRTFINYAGDAVFIIDNEFNINETNASACNMLGYSELELKSKKLFELLNTKDIGDFYAKIEYIKTYGGSVHERQLIKKDGVMIEVEANVKPLSNEGYVTIIRDLSERKKNQKELIESESKYKYLFQHNPACIIIWSLTDLNVLEVNEEVVNKYGYTAEEWKTMSVLDYRPVEHHQDIIDFARRMLKNNTKISTNKWVHLKKNGEEMIMEISSHKINYDNQTAILSLAKDITEQVKSQQHLKKSEEKFHALLDNAADSIFVISYEGHIIEVNQSACYLLGYTKAEFLNQHYLQFYPHDIINNQKELWDVNGVNRILIGEKKLRSKDGSFVDVEISLNLLPDTSYGIAIVRDISGRKKIEAELYEKKEQLALFVEYSPASLAMFDTEMRYIATSKRWLVDYKITLDTIIGKTHYEVFPEVPEHWKAIHTRCLNGAIEKMEEDAFIREDGSIEWLKWEIRPWFKANGAIGGIIMFTEVITERKKATELFNYQFFNSPDTIMIVNSDFIIMNINKGQLGGYSAQELTGMNCIDILPEESGNIAREHILNCFKTGENQNFEIKIEYNRWARARMVGIKVNGVVEGVMIISSDITVSKNAEDKLKQSDERQRVLIENISDAIITVDENLIVSYHSPSATRIVGYEASETVGKSVLSFLHPDDVEACQKTIDYSLENPSVSVSYQYRVVHKNGQWIWIEGTILNLLHNESVKSFIINYRDISERKKYEKQQRLITSIVESTDDAIISKDMSGCVTSWNSGAEKLLGYKSEEILNQPISILIPPSIKLEEDRILHTINEGHSIDHFETSRMKKDGEVIDVSLTISPIKDDFGNVVGASKIMRDISMQKQHEMEKQKVINELFNQNLALQQFAYIVSHNLRGPVANIIGIADYLTADEMDLSKQEFLLNGLKVSINKLDDVIGDLNSILAIKGPSNTDMKFVKFQDLVCDIYKSMANIIEEEKVSIESDFQVEGMETNKSYFNSIFYNIISNSIKYKQATKPSLIKISSRMVDSKIEILFEDNGLGFDKNRHEKKLFGLYKRFHSHTDGKGMGLFMVKTQVESLGGTISIDSEINVGTKVRLMFNANIH